MLYDKERWEPKTVVLEPWRQALLDAADVIRKRGWCQHKISSHGRVCLFGALSVATGHKPNSAEGSIHWRAAAEMQKLGFTASWNDAPERKKVEVIEALEAVAKS